MPIASQFFQVSEWQELVEMVPVREHRQCLLSLARERIKNDPDYTEISCNDEARMLGAGFSKPVGGRDHSKHIEELKRKYGGDEDPEYSDLDRKLIAKFRQ